jgi:REP element-mobilizing transposase RayT
MNRYKNTSVSRLSCVSILPMVRTTAHPSRRSIRLPSHDYRCPGAYFVTMCTWRRHPMFGRVHEGEMNPNVFGRIAGELWTEIPQHFPSVRIDEFVVMPDHVHGIIVIDRWVQSHRQQRSDAASTLDIPGHHPRGPKRGSLAAIIGSYKSIVTRRINQLRGTPGTRVWLRNYYERIIRSEEELQLTRRYIRQNPAASGYGRRNAR